MKSKRTILGSLFLSLLLVGLLTTAVYADPPPYQEDPNPPWWSGGHKAIVTDPLVGPEGRGYVRFLCQSQTGFEYSVGIKKLEPSAKYAVVAVALPFIVVGPGVVLPTTDYPMQYSLGTITTDNDGDGEVEGLISLTPPAPDPGLYAWRIEVRNAANDVALHTLDDDPADFIVFP